MEGNVQQIHLLSYIRNVWRNSKFVFTFFKFPSDVPRNATVCRSVVAMETETSELFGKWMAAWLLIGDTPEIFNPTSQKFNMLPVSWKGRIQIGSSILLQPVNVRNACHIKYRRKTLLYIVKSGRKKDMSTNRSIIWHKPAIMSRESWVVNFPGESSELIIHNSTHLLVLFFLPPWL